MSKADEVFVRQFLMVLGALVAFTIVVLFLARGIGGAAFENKRNDPADVAARIAPVGEVRIAGQTEAREEAEAPEAAPAASASASAGKSGDQVYNTVCMACHSTGAAGAPKLGDKAAWEARASGGLDALVTSAVKGKNAMPPKGGNPALADDDIRSAVRYILEQAGLPAS